MAPMTRQFSPGGIPTPDVVEYYRKRAAGEVALILTEGTVVDRPAASNNSNIPHFYGGESLNEWEKVASAVHGEGGKIGPQIWHQGVVQPGGPNPLPQELFEGPSGLLGTGAAVGRTMTEEDIADTIAAFASAAADAKRIGFDMLELHGAHGYLIDQFFWDFTNRRSDRYGGPTIADRVQFGVEVTKAVRKAVGEDFVISLRISQWKISGYDIKIAKDPTEMEAWLGPLSEAGVDIFHCSQRRFWEPEFEGSDLNTAGWAKKITGKPTITVGSVGLSGEFMSSLREGTGADPTPLDELQRRLERGDFDLVAVGRALISDPNWVQKVGEGKFSEMKGYSKESLATLV